MHKKIGGKATIIYNVGLGSFGNEDKQQPNEVVNKNRRQREIMFEVRNATYVREIQDIKGGRKTCFG